MDMGRTPSSLSFGKFIVSPFSIIGRLMGGLVETAGRFRQETPPLPVQNRAPQRTKRLMARNRMASRAVSPIVSPEDAPTVQNPLGRSEILIDNGNIYQIEIFSTARHPFVNLPINIYPPHISEESKLEEAASNKINLTKLLFRCSFIAIARRSAIGLASIIGSFSFFITSYAALIIGRCVRLCRPFGGGGGGGGGGGLPTGALPCQSNRAAWLDYHPNIGLGVGGYRNNLSKAFAHDRIERAYCDARYRIADRSSDLLSSHEESFTSGGNIFFLSKPP